MEEMSLNINQNILIVSVLDLQDVADQRVCCKRVDEVVNCSLILLRGCLSELVFEVVYDG